MAHYYHLKYFNKTNYFETRDFFENVRQDHRDTYQKMKNLERLFITYKREGNKEMMIESFMSLLKA